MINSHKVTKHACTSSWLPLKTPYIPSSYSNQQTTKETKAINKSYIYIYIHISCKCDTNHAGHFTLDAHASRPVVCLCFLASQRQQPSQQTIELPVTWNATTFMRRHCDDRVNVYCISHRMCTQFVFLRGFTVNIIIGSNVSCDLSKFFRLTNSCIGAIVW